MIQSQVMPIQKSLFEPSNFSELMELAKFVANSELVPKNYRGKPADIVIASQRGKEIGLSFFHSLESLTVINGRVTLWGDAALALVVSHPHCEDVLEEQTDSHAKCTVLRKGKRPKEYIFTRDDAKQAGLLSKDGCWRTYPKRMMQMRARSFALRDSFPDVLKGISIAEEVMDYSENTKTEYKTSNDLLKDKLGLNSSTKISISEEKQELQPNIQIENKYQTVECPISESESLIINDPIKSEESDIHLDLVLKLGQCIEEGKIDSQTLSKWMERAKVEKISDLTVDQLLAALDRIKLLNKE